MNTTDLACGEPLCGQLQNAGSSVILGSRDALTKTYPEPIPRRTHPARVAFKKSRNKEGDVKAHVAPNLLMSKHFGLEENLFVGIWL